MRVCAMYASKCHEVFMYDSAYWRYVVHNIFTSTLFAVQVPSANSGVGNPVDTSNHAEVRVCALSVCALSVYASVGVWCVVCRRAIVCACAYVCVCVSAHDHLLGLGICTRTRTMHATCTQHARNAQIGFAGTPQPKGRAGRPAHTLPTHYPHITHTPPAPNAEAACKSGLVRCDCALASVCFSICVCM